MPFERIHTVSDFYDGPRSGIADYCGEPHYYECEWDNDLDDYADTFVLTPIDRDTLILALEKWAIWRKWEWAYHRGEVAESTHPAWAVRTRVTMSWKRSSKIAFQRSLVLGNGRTLNFAQP